MLVSAPSEVALGFWTDRSVYLERQMGVAWFGDRGTPILAFPPASCNEWIYEEHGVIDAIDDYIRRGTVRVFTLRSVDGDAFLNRAATPRERSLMQRRYDEYVRLEAIPRVRAACDGQALVSFGVAFGAFHAVNTLLKHPAAVKRCFALSGAYNVSQHMDGQFDDNFYFNNPLDYIRRLEDPAILNELSRCFVHVVSIGGRGRHPSDSFDLVEALRHRVPVSHHHWGDSDTDDWSAWRGQFRDLVEEFVRAGH